LDQVLQREVPDKQQHSWQDGCYVYLLQHRLVFVSRHVCRPAFEDHVIGDVRGVGLPAALEQR